MEPRALGALGIPISCPPFPPRICRIEIAVAMARIESDRESERGRDRGEIRRFVLIRGLKRPRGQFSSGLKAGVGITRGKAPGEIYRRGLR